jgi:hypothetical protein
MIKITNLISVAVILIIAVAGLALEYARRSKNDSDKELRQQERIANMEKQLSELEINLTNQSAQMLQLERLIQHHVSPPSPSPSSSSSGSSLLSTGKQKLANAFSMVDTTSVRSPLIQLNTADYLVFPVIYAIQQTNDRIITPIKQWSSLGRRKH